MPRLKMEPGSECLALFLGRPPSRPFSLLEIFLAALAWLPPIEPHGGGRHQPHACCTAGEELPCHPHVKDKSSSVVKMNEKVFSAPLEIGNGSPQEA